MSIQQNRNFRFWKDVLDDLGRTLSLRENIAISHNDNLTINQAIVMNAMIVSDMLPDASSASPANLKRWCIYAKSLDLVQLNSVMKDTVLLLRTAERMSYDVFKQRLSHIEVNIGAFMAPVKPYLLGHISDPNASDFRVLNQFLSFMTRVNLMDVDFSKESLEEYYATEHRLSRYDYKYITTEILPIAMSVRSIIQGWFRDFTMKSPDPSSGQDTEGNLIPCHGPGGSAFIGRTSDYLKFKDMKFDQLLLEFVASYPTLDKYIPEYRVGNTRTAEVVFVPKSLSSMRTICMEPTSLMYFQQAIWRETDVYMKNHKIVGAHITLHDQSQNAAMAREGSLNQKYATIDLSAASDSVSWDLMEFLFAGTEYYKGALSTRSTSASLPDGTVLELKKFAPMGSTLCFPTQCLIFAALCKQVAIENGDYRLDSFSVYGDDIVIREEYTERLCELLSLFGFVLNESKSYLRGRFKESCGGEYFDGVDVTPLKIPRNYEGKRLTSRMPSLYAMLQEFCNTCTTFGYRSVRNYLISRFTHLPTTLLPLFDDGTRGIESPEPSNFHLKKKVKPAHQCGYLIHGENKSPDSQKRIEDSLSLFMWHIQACRKTPSRVLFKTPEDITIVRTEPSRTVLRSVESYDPVGSITFAVERLYEIYSRSQDTVR